MIVAMHAVNHYKYLLDSDSRPRLPSGLFPVQAVLLCSPPEVVIGDGGKQPVTHDSTC